MIVLFPLAFFYSIHLFTYCRYYSRVTLCAKESIIHQEADFLFSDGKHNSVTCPSNMMDGRVTHSYYQGRIITHYVLCVQKNDSPKLPEEIQ